MIHICSGHTDQHDVTEKWCCQNAEKSFLYYRIMMPFLQHFHSLILGDFLILTLRSRAGWLTMRMQPVHQHRSDFTKTEFWHMKVNDTEHFSSCCLAGSTSYHEAESVRQELWGEPESNAALLQIHRLPREQHDQTSSSWGKYRRKLFSFLEIIFDH